MKIANWPFYFGGFFSLWIGFLLGSLFFGMVVHELSHVMACIVFGLRIGSFSLLHVICEGSPNPLVKISVRLAGGIGQTLLSLLFFGFTTTLEKMAFRQTVLKRIELKRSLALGIVFGFELALLTIAFHGVANAIWEGFFFESYSWLHENVLLSGISLLFSSAISLLFLQRRYRRLVLMRQKK